MRSIINSLALALAFGTVATFLYRTRAGLRRRIKLAFWTAVLGYALIVTIRLVQDAPDQAQLATLGAVAGGFGVIWLALWVLVRRKGDQAT